MTQNQLYVRYTDGKKQLFIVKGDQIVTKDVFVVEPD